MILNRRLFILILLFAGVAVVVSLDDRAPIRLHSRCPAFEINKDFQEYMDGVISEEYPGPVVYRVLTPYLVFWLHKGMPSVSPVTFDFFIKIFVLIAIQLSFFEYLRFFHNSFQALAGVFLFDALIGLTLSYHHGPSLPETGDLINVLVFILALTALYLDRFALLCLILFVGTFNRETTWVLLPVFFLYNFLESRSMWRLMTAFVAVAVPYFGLRWLIDTPAPIWFRTDAIQDNIPLLAEESTHYALISNVYFFVLLGPLVVTSLYQFRAHPRFLRIVGSIVPLFIVIHYAVGRIIETRIWMPLFIVLIPLVLNNLVKVLQSETSS